MQFNDTLLRLDLSGNNLTSASYTLVFGALHHNKSICRIYLGDLPTPSEARTDLLAAQLEPDGDGGEATAKLRQSLKMFSGVVKLLDEGHDQNGLIPFKAMIKLILSGTAARITIAAPYIYTITSPHIYTCAAPGPSHTHTPSHLSRGHTALPCARGWLSFALRRPRHHGQARCQAELRASCGLRR